jgi:hypothetical protein
MKNVSKSQPISEFELMSEGEYDAMLKQKEAAECAPREAQPEPESACNPADICAGCRCEYSQSAAPTPERAQDDESIIETPCHKEVGNHRIPKIKPRKVNYDVDDYGPVERAQELRKDAQRYKWLAERFTGYDFDWMSSGHEADDGKSVVVFDVGREFRGGRDITAAIDAAMAKKEGA